MTTLTGPSAQPRIRENDYSVLRPPILGEWEPTLSVSVVMPAYRAQEKLDLALAALAAQSYPAHLLEVVVADDGSDPPLRLPEIRPERTRLVPSLPGGWGCAHAYRSGALAAQGEVILRLDSDMLVFHDHVEAQLRWHHLADHLVVVGHKRFVDYRPGLLTPRAVHDAVQARKAEKLFDIGQSKGHHYEPFIEKTDRLRTAGAQASRAFTGATASYHRGLYHDAGGVDSEMILGEDTEFGYRLGQAGAVFIPELTSSSWHLGWSTTMVDSEHADRYCRPFYANRVLIPRNRRPDPGRQWRVPGVVVVVDAATGKWEQVRSTVSGLTSGPVPDVRIDLVAPWSDLREGRRSLFEDPMLDLRLMREGLGGDGRVRFVESMAETAFPSPYRFVCPPDWAPTPWALQRLIRLVEKEGYGLVVLDLPDDQGNAALARFEQTRAYRRAHRVRRPGEAIDDAVHEMFGTLAIDGTEWALVRAGDEPPGPAVDWEAEASRWRTEAERLRRDLRESRRRYDRTLHRRARRKARRLLSPVLARGRRLSGKN